jgi:hypothetical protein
MKSNKRVRGTGTIVGLFTDRDNITWALYYTTNGYYGETLGGWRTSAESLDALKVKINAGK